MKFLADMGLSMSTVLVLRASGHDVIHFRELGLHKLPDGQIALKAKAEGRVVLTFDLDFGEILAASNDASPSVVLFRLKDQTPQAVTPRLQQVIQEAEGDLLSGSIIVVQDEGYRVRRLPIRPAP